MGNQRVPFEQGKIYHVYHHGNGTDNIFRSDENRRYFMEKYTHYIMPIADTFCYCLLPNHFHFLVRIKENPQGLEDLAGLKPISQIFSNFLNAYAKAFNKQYERRGSLFLDNIQRKPVENEAYFSELIRYIHYNPVKHGFVPKPSDWYWSSFHAFSKPNVSKLCRDEVLMWFGNLEVFLLFHEQPPDQNFLNQWDCPF